MTLSEELQWRGFVQQTTFDDISLLDREPLTFYHGFDASADSQTIGNLAAMMADKVFMRHGYKAILLAGGATSLIGDPGGKDKERQLQSEETISANVENARTQLERVFSGYEFTLVNNLDWTKDIKVLDFLRDIGKHFSMTPLIQREYIAERIGEGGSGISYTEFSYTLLQGMDYLHLYDNYGVKLQLGGSDQWGNCLSGVELIRKSRGAETHVITLPLVINKATGKKFGKSEDGAVWLDDNKTSVFKFYQFWINADDEGVEDYIKVFTELDKDTVDNLMNEHRQQPQLRIAQKRLAFEVTKIVHGEGRAKSAERVTAVVFGGDAVENLSNGDASLLKTEIPVFIASGTATIIEALLSTGLASSSSEARRFLTEKAIYLDGVQWVSDSFEIDNQRLEKGFALLRRGKNQLALIVKEN